MQSLASLIMRGRAQAVMVVTVCAVLSLLFPLFGYLGAAAVALVTLRLGAYSGLWLVAGSSAATALLSWLVVHTAIPAATLLLTQWLPVWATAIALRVTGVQGIAVTVAGVIGLTAIAAIHLLIASPVDWWRALLGELFAPVLSNPDMQMAPEILDTAARLMTGMAAAGTVLGVLIALLLGRWWQATLYNPGGFGVEFRALRLHRGVALVTLGTLLLGMLGDGPVSEVAREALMVGLALHLLQGLALAHAVVAARRASIGWLVGLYLLMFLWAPYGLLLAGGAGFIDVWVDFRGRIRVLPKTND